MKKKKILKCFLYFGKWNILLSSSQPKKTSYISGGTSKAPKTKTHYTFPGKI